MSSVTASVTRLLDALGAGVSYLSLSYDCMEKERVTAERVSIWSESGDRCASCTTRWLRQM